MLNSAEKKEGYQGGNKIDCQFPIEIISDSIDLKMIDYLRCTRMIVGMCWYSLFWYSLSADKDQMQGKLRSNAR